jgi:hypothetical protein
VSTEYRQIITLFLQNKSNDINSIFRGEHLYL